MQITLRSLVLAPVILAAVAFTANSAMAETKVNVPFNFMVNGQVCPAGQYTLQGDIWGNSVKLEGASRSFTWLISPGDAAPNDKRVILRFDQVGSRQFLHSVQYRGEVTSRIDKRSRELERASMSMQTVQGQ
jgi:hypothetical protein